MGDHSRRPLTLLRKYGEQERDPSHRRRTTNDNRYRGLQWFTRMKEIGRLRRLGGDRIDWEEIRLDAPAAFPLADC